MGNIRFFLVSVFIFFSFNTISAQVPCSSGFTANGVDDFIHIPDTDNINTMAVSNRTIEFWFKTNNIVNRQILYKEGGGTKAITMFIEGGRFYCGIYTNSPGEVTFFRSITADAIASNTWYHVAFTIDIGADNFSWFLNGNFQRERNLTFTLASHGANIVIGKVDTKLKYPSSFNDGNWPFDIYTGSLTGNDSNDYHLNGNISLFRIWNVTRTQGQIDDDKLNYLTTGTGLVAYQKGEGDIVMYEPSGSGTSIASSAVGDGVNTTYTWTGASSNVWANSSNWLGGTMPDVTKAQTIVINSGGIDPYVFGEVKVGRLAVDSGAEMKLQLGATVSVYSKLTNNGTISVPQSASLVYHPCNAPIAGTNNFIVTKRTPNYPDPYMYSYWSSPIENANPAVVFPSSPVIWRFDSSSNNADWVSNSGANLIPGVGYAIRSETAGERDVFFNGKINEGEITVPVYFKINLASTDPGNVWSFAGDNLLGNPYAAAIDWDAIIKDEEANSGLEGEVYFWNQTNAVVGDNNVSDYIQYNLTGGSTGGATNIIASGQGFFIRTTSPTPNIFTFKPSYQVSGSNTQFYKGIIPPNKRGRSWFLLKKKTGTVFSSILIGFVKGATGGYDRLYDAPFDINNTKLGLYSLVEKITKNHGPPPPPGMLIRTSIQGLPLLKKKGKKVSLGFVVDEVGMYAIKIDVEYIPKRYKIFLYDVKKNKIVNLRKKAYNFAIHKTGENNNRFKLYYTKSRKDIVVDIPVVEKAKLLAFVNTNNNLIVELKNSTDIVKWIRLFGRNGRIIYKFSATETINVSRLKSGVYIVSAILNSNKKLNTKIIIVN